MSANTLYLASASPRRRELLAQIGAAFEVLAVAVDETRHADETPETHVRRVAELKAAAGWQARPTPGCVLAADTVVILDGRTLGKPANRADGQRMLRELSARSHVVLTAVALATDQGLKCRVSHSEVTFRAIAPTEAEVYWSTGEPKDKAGGYAIQGRAAVFVAALRGSYSGVMGLPLYETAELLQQAEVGIWNAAAG